MSKKKAPVAILNGKIPQRVLRVGDLVTFLFTAIEYGEDDKGPYVIVDVGENLPEAGGQFYVKDIAPHGEGDEQTFTLSPLEKPTALDTPAEGSPPPSGLAIAPNELPLWTDGEQQEQGNLALSLLREMEFLENEFREVSANHKNRIKGIKLQLRALAHGSFPTPDRPSIFDEPPTLPSKVDPAALPSPKDLAGDQLAARAANADGEGHAVSARASKIKSFAEKNVPGPGKRRKPIEVETVGGTGL